MRNRVYNNPGKFRRVPMEESLSIYDIPEPCQIRTGIWMSLGCGLQSPARRSFGRSNRSLAAEFPYQPPLKISARSDRPNSGNLPTSASLFGFIFCARTNLTRIHLFMNGISDILFEGSFVWGIVFCSQTHPTNFKVFSNMIFTIAPVSNQPDNVALRLPTCARHVVALLSRAQLLRIIISSSRTRVRHREG